MHEHKFFLYSFPTLARTAMLTEEESSLSDEWNLISQKQSQYEVPIIIIIIKTRRQHGFLWISRLSLLEGLLDGIQCLHRSG